MAMRRIISPDQRARIVAILYDELHATIATEATATTPAATRRSNVTETGDRQMPEDGWYDRYGAMKIGDTLACTADECVWTFTATPGDIAGIVRHNQHVFVRYECPLYPDEVAPGSAMAGGKLTKTLNLLALRHQRALPGRRVGLKPFGLNLRALYWLALIILHEQPRPTTAAEIHALLDKQDDEDLTRRALLLHRRGESSWPSGVEGAFRDARRIGLVECDWRQRPWTWWITDAGHDLLVTGRAVTPATSNTTHDPRDPMA